VPVISRIVVTPWAIMIFNSSSASASGNSSSLNRWTCMSVSPGIRNFPRPSILRASRGTRTFFASPISAITPSRTITV
jgi:hypothetical protein